MIRWRRAPPAFRDPPGRHGAPLRQAAYVCADPRTHDRLSVHCGDIGRGELRELEVQYDRTRHHGRAAVFRRVHRMRRQVRSPEVRSGEARGVRSADTDPLESLLCDQSIGRAAGVRDLAPATTGPRPCRWRLRRARRSPCKQPRGCLPARRHVRSQRRRSGSPSPRQVRLFVVRVIAGLVTSSRLTAKIESDKFLFRAVIQNVYWRPVDAVSICWQRNFADGDIEP